jgi:hypothetical protein
VRFPQSLREIDRDTRRKMYGIVMRCLDAQTHFGGALGIEVHHALLLSERYLKSVISVALTLEFLDALAARGSVLKIEGKVITTWKVNDESD